MSEEGGARPVLRVISGDATPEEIAAILAIVAARAGGREASAPDDAQARTWAARGSAHRHIRATFTPSPHGWKTSYWPR